jgi:hypothetical protein
MFVCWSNVPIEQFRGVQHGRACHRDLTIDGGDSAKGDVVIHEQNILSNPVP